MMPSGIEPAAQATSTSPRIFVHGFLGLTSDWESFAVTGRDQLIDLWSIARRLRAGDAGLQAFSLATMEILEAARRCAERPCLIAYSLGARLAIHALLAEPSLFSAAVLVSSNPGLTEESERQERLRVDRRWAQRFRTDEWGPLLADWNAQAVLRSPSEANSKFQDRRESLFDRESLALALEAWSLGSQRDLRGELRQLELPLLFVTGAEDEKFTTIHRQLLLLVGRARHRHEVITGAGHRVPWDRPRQFRGLVDDFLKSCR